MESRKSESSRIVREVFPGKDREIDKGRGFLLFGSTFELKGAIWGNKVASNCKGLKLIKLNLQKISDKRPI